MRALTLAVRGLWWRRGASAVIGLVAVVCVAVAAAGPAYAAAAGDAVVQTTLREAPVDADGTGLSVSRGVKETKPDVGALRTDARSAFRAVVDAGEYAAPVYSIQSAAHVLDVANMVAVTSPVVFRDGVCEHVVMVAGSCLSDDNAAVSGVIVSQTTASQQGWSVGKFVPFKEFAPSTGFPALTVRGVYRAVDPGAAYWFAGTHDYFGASATTDAVFVAANLWVRAPLPASLQVTLYADLAFVPAAVHERDLAGLADRVRLGAALLRASPGNTGYADVVTTSLPSVVYRAEQAANSVAAPVTAVVAQLLVLSFAVLFLLMVGSHESRGGEVALGKLRGLSSRAAVAHAVLEPTLVLAAAVPAGVGVAAFVLHAGAPSVVGHDAVVTVGAASWIAAVAAGAAGVIAGLVAGVAVLRRPVLAQWQRTERRPRRLGWIAEAVVVALALGATSQLQGVDLTTGRFAFLPSAAPALFAVAFALIGARLLPLVARAGFAPTRASRLVGTFVALRQLARRRGGLRAFGVICVAVALVVFGLCSHVVFQANRQARAVAEVGADRVVSLQPAAAGTDVAAVVDGLDPGGREATAVYQGPYLTGPDDVLSTGGADFDPPTSDTPPTLLVVDPDRFTRVASWSSQDDDGRSLADALTPLRTATPTFVPVKGTTLHMAGTVASSSTQPAVLHVGLTDALGGAFDVTLGAVRTTPGPVGAAGTPIAFDFTAKVARCNNGCLLRQLAVAGQPTVTPPLRIDVRFTTVAAVDAAGRETSVLPTLTTAGWTPYDDSAASVVTERDTPLSVTLRVSATDPSGFDVDGFGAYVGYPLAVPGLVTTSQQSTIVGGNVNLAAGTATPFSVSPSVVDLLPRAGDAGVLVTRDWLAAAEPDGFVEFTPNQVWLSASAPADFPARLTAAGLVVASVETVAERSAVLARQGPSLAVAALGFGAAAGAVLAIAGAAATFVVAARRRLYELAALRALGLRPRRIWLSVVAEQLVTAVVAALFGAVAGLLGARVALEVLPEFGDTPSFPPLVVDLPVGGSALAAGAVALAVAVVTGVLAAGLVRRADTSRLRDSQG